jgi:hypothetical protein
VPEQCTATWIGTKPLSFRTICRFQMSPTWTHSEADVAQSCHISSGTSSSSH